MPDKKTKKGSVIVDLDRCLACKSCEIECARAHAGFDDIVDAVLSEEPMAPRVRVIAASDRAVPVQCQHCEDAPCVEVCPSGALYKEEEEGPTRTAPEKCIGCKNCVYVCPFGAIEWDGESDTVVKCDLCEDIVEEGEQPVCVTACPTHARRMVTMKEAADRRRKKAAEQTVAAYEKESGDE